MNFNRSFESDLSADPDLALVRDFKSGKTAAFDRLYDRYSTYVYNVCLGMVGNPDDARDVMQETFVKIYRALPKFLGQSKFSTWVYRITVNKCIDLIRSRPKCGVSETLDWVEEKEAPGADSLEEEHVRKLILTMPEEHRSLLVLHYFQELTYQEIAETLGMKIDQVRAGLHRARKVFRRLYEESETL